MATVRRTAWLAAVLGASCAMAAAPDHPPFHTLMREAKDYIFERAVHPKTHLIYGDVNLEDPKRWENTVFPTPESIRGRTCDDSEKPNVSQLPHQQRHLPVHPGGLPRGDALAGVRRAGPK